MFSLLWHGNNHGKGCPLYNKNAPPDQAAPEGVSVGLGEDENIYAWEVMIVGPPDTLYEGGFFQAKLDFPQVFK